jgi:hypothetical protein
MSGASGIDDELRYEPGEPLRSSRLIETEAHKRLARRKRFIAGPFSWSQFCTASRLPGKALSVWELAQHRKRVTGLSAVTLPNEMLEEAGINEDAKSRALKLLEQAGLIKVARSPGRSPRIALVELEACDGRDVRLARGWGRCSE